MPSFRISFSALPLVIATAVSQVNSFVILVFFARVGTKDSLADFRLAFTAMGFASVIALPGCAVAISRASARGLYVARAVTRKRLPWAVGGAFALAITGLGIVQWGSASTGIALIAASGVFVPYALSDAAGAHFIGGREFGRFLYLQCLVQVSTALGVCLLVALEPNTAWPAVLGYYGLTALVQLWFLFHLRDSDDTSEASEVQSFGKRLSLTSVAGTLDEEMDVLTVATLLPKAEVAGLAIARTPPMLLKRVWQIIFQAHIARMSVASLEASRGIARRLAIRVVALFATIGIAGCALAPFLVPLVFGSEYDQSVSTLQLLLLAPVVAAPGSCYELHLTAQARLPQLYVLQGVKLAASVLLLPLFVWQFGLIGVGLEALVNAAIYSATGIGLANRLSGRGDLGQDAGEGRAPGRERRQESDAPALADRYSNASDMSADASPRFATSEARESARRLGREVRTLLGLRSELRAVARGRRPEAQAASRHSQRRHGGRSARVARTVLMTSVVVAAIVLGGVAAVMLGR